MPKRVLLTGAGGFIGSHTLQHILTNTDWEVVVTDSFRHKGKTDRINQVLSGECYLTDEGPSWPRRTTVITHDLCAPFSEQMRDRIGHIDYVIAMASESHVDRSIAEPVPFVKNNVDVALNTLEYARITGAEHTLLISTDEIYGPVAKDDMVGHPEWDAIIPSNPYSASKAAQEAIAISYWRTYKLPLTIVNCMNLIGEMQDSEKYVPMLIGRINAGQEVTIHGTPGEVGTRHYLHARNLADALIFMLKRPPKQFPDFSRPERFNLAGPDRVDNLELAYLVAEMQGKPLRFKLVDFHSTRPGHDPHYGLDGTKLREAGWTMPMTFEDSLERTVKWTLAHPEWLK